MAACIVVYDNDLEGCWPYSFDDDCEGALCASGGPVAFFGDRTQAQRAITISTRYAELCRAQGTIANEDFLGAERKKVKVRTVVAQHTDK